MTTPAAPPRTRYVDGLWHRLHPATPLLRGGIGLLAVLIYVAGNFREHLVAWLFRIPDVGGDPVDEIGRRGLVGPAALIVLGVIVVGIGLFWISWRASEFRIDGDAVTVRQGVLLRRNRTARLDRIQGVTISRPLLARIVGAARIELDVAGQNAERAARVPDERRRGGPAARRAAARLRPHAGRRGRRLAGVRGARRGRPAGPARHARARDRVGAAVGDDRDARRRGGDRAPGAHRDGGRPGRRGVLPAAPHRHGDGRDPADRPQPPVRGDLDARRRPGRRAAS